MVEFININNHELERQNQAALDSRDGQIASLSAQLRSVGGYKEKYDQLKSDNDRMRRMFKVHQKDKAEILKLFEKYANENVELKKKKFQELPSFRNS